VIGVRGKLALGIGFCAGIAFLLIVLHAADLREVWRVVREADYRLSIPFLIVIALLYWIRSVRWSILLRPLKDDIRARDVFPAVMIAFSSAMILPPPLGEFVRMYIISKQLELRSVSVLASIALERAFDLLSIVLLVGFALAVAPKPSEEFAVIGVLGATLAGLVLAFSVAYYLWNEQLIRFMRYALRVFPARLEGVLSNQLELVNAGLLALRSKKSVANLVVLTLAQWALMASAIFVSFVAVGVMVHASAAFLVLAFTFAGVSLPTTPGAVGTVQLAFALGLGAYGVGTSDAVAASIFWQGIAYSFILVLGVYHFIRLGYTVSEIGSVVRSSGDAGTDQ
jgi:uncharacterized protein (TIRG00374 family)